LATLTIDQSVPLPVAQQAAWLIQQQEPPTQNNAALAREALVSVHVVGAATYSLLCTPFEIEALAVGFAYTEGLLNDAEDIVSITTEPTGLWSSAVKLELRHELDHSLATRNLIVTSSCGLCGKQIEDGLTGVDVGSKLRVQGCQMIRLAAHMWEQQTLFKQTGGTHAAGIFDDTDELLAFAEDSGRHNALDKAIGKLLLSGRHAKGCGVILSGRISYELVTKAARAGLEVLAGVSAPSALAAEAAALRNITLCGFVRDDRMTVYTHPHRVAELANCGASCRLDASH
jgi:FdhD protein